MIDIAILRQDPERVKENMKKKFQDEKLHIVDEVLDIDVKYREAVTRASEIRSQRNTLSKEIGLFMRNGEKDKAEEKIVFHGCPGTRILMFLIIHKSWKH